MHKQLLLLRDCLLLTFMEANFALWQHVNLDQREQHLTWTPAEVTLDPRVEKHYEICPRVHAKSTGKQTYPHCGN